jgi:hypothetical protein
MEKQIFAVAATIIGLALTTALIFTFVLAQQQTILAQVDVSSMEKSPAVNQTLQPPTENASNITGRAPENMTSE